MSSRKFLIYVIFIVTKSMIWKSGQVGPKSQPARTEGWLLLSRCALQRVTAITLSLRDRLDITSGGFEVSMTPTHFNRLNNGFHEHGNVWFPSMPTDFFMKLQFASEKWRACANHFHSSRSQTADSWTLCAWAFACLSQSTKHTLAY